MKPTKNRRIIYFLVVCILLVAGLSIWHLKTRENVPKYHILVTSSNQKTYLDLEKIKTTPVSGQIVNGKGETKDVSGDGIALYTLLQAYLPDTYETITVCADDEYQASLTKEELLLEGNAYLLIEDQSARLYVFGDENSKRNVSKVVKIMIQ